MASVSAPQELAYLSLRSSSNSAARVSDAHLTVVQMLQKELEDAREEYAKMLACKNRYKETALLNARQVDELVKAMELVTQSAEQDKVKLQESVDEITACKNRYKAAALNKQHLAEELEAAVAAAEEEKEHLRLDMQQIAEEHNRMRELAEQEAQKALDLAAQKRAAEEESQRLADHLSHLKEDMSKLENEHDKVLQAQEMLQAELEVALDMYKPKQLIDTGTPADRLSAMMAGLLDGVSPSHDDIHFMQSVLHSSRNIYAVSSLGEQLQTSNLDADVSDALNSVLGDSRSIARTAAPEAVSLEDFCSSRKSSSQVMISGFSSAKEALLHPEHANGNGERGITTSGPTFSRTSSLGASSCSTGSHIDAVTPLQATLAMLLSGATSSPCIAESCSNGTGSSTHLLDSSGGSGAATLLSGHQLCSGGGLLSHGSGPMPGVQSFSMGGALAAGGHKRGSLDAGSGSPRMIHHPRPPLFLEVESSLAATVHCWQWDAFKLDELSQGHALSTLSFYLWSHSGIISQFKLPPTILARYLRRIEQGYSRQNPYHNHVHAADVLHSYHNILAHGGLISGYADPLTLMACYLAAAIHDFEHVGCTNDYLVMSNHALAMRYNDKAPLENHHLASALTLLCKPEFNFLSHLPKADQERLRKTVIELVLGTDMKQHFAMLGQFRTVHRLVTPSGNSPCASHIGSIAQLQRSNSRASEAGFGLHSSQHLNSNDGLSLPPLLVPIDETERILSLSIALKCADLGHMCASLAVHTRWVNALEAEFFRQGDLERNACLPISPLFDRHKQGVSKSQVGFLQIVAIPMYQALCSVFSVRPLLAYLLRNHKHWMAVAAEGNTQPVVSGQGSFKVGSATAATAVMAAAPMVAA